MAVSFKRFRVGIAGFSALMLAACSGSVTEGVMSSYADYSAAVAAGRGYDAAQFVTEDTITQFDRLRLIALYGEDGGARLGIYDEVAVYYLRSEFDASHLQRLTGRDVMNILVTADLIGERGFRGYEVGTITEESSSSAVLALRDSESGASYTLRFVKENGDWVADWRSFRTQRDRRLENRIEEFNGDRRSVISELLIVHGAQDGLTRELSQPLIPQN